MHTSDRRVHTWQNLWAASFACDCIHTHVHTRIDTGLSIAVPAPIHTHSVSSEFSGVSSNRVLMELSSWKIKTQKGTGSHQGGCTLLWQCFWPENLESERVWPGPMNAWRPISLFLLVFKAAKELVYILQGGHRLRAKSEKALASCLRQVLAAAIDRAGCGQRLVWILCDPSDLPVVTRSRAGACGTGKEGIIWDTWEAGCVGGSSGASRQKSGVSPGERMADKATKRN